MLREKVASLSSSQKKILGLELSLILFCIAVFVYSAIGHPTLELLILPFAAILFIPFFATFAYYKRFRRTSISAILSIFLAPVVGLIIILANTPSKAGGLLVVFMLIYSAIASAIIPYIVFAASLILHYYRSKIE